MAFVMVSNGYSSHSCCDSGKVRSLWKNTHSHSFLCSPLWQDDWHKDSTGWVGFMFFSSSHKKVIETVTTPNSLPIQCYSFYDNNKWL